MIISRTPFRISFFGGGTDYAPWFREHGGAVLSTGSVAWAGSLGDLPAGNDVARLMGRAVGRFLEPTPFQYPHPRPPIHPPGQRTKERDRDAQDP